MEDETREIIGKLNDQVASISILRHLALALFDAIQDKERVINQFDDTTKRTHIYTLYSSMPESFFSAFEKERDVLLKLLVDAQAASTPRRGSH